MEEGAAEILNSGAEQLAFEGLADPAAYDEPAEEYIPDPQERDAAIVRSARTVYSRLGFRAFFTLLLTIGASVLVMLIGGLAITDLADSVTGVLILSMISTHLIAMPCGCAMMRGIPVFETQPERLGGGALLKCIPVCMFFAYAGNLLGTELNKLLCMLFNAPYSDPVSGIASPDMPFIGMLIPLVIVGPFMEELLFRKYLIDRMRGYGERMAIVTSALMFGMFHGNVIQFTYATLLGLVLGYVYTRTRSLGKCFALHAFVNFYSGVLATKLASGEGVEFFLEKLDEGDLELAFMELEDPQVMAFLIYIILTLILALAGLVILLVSIKRLRFTKTQLQVPKGKGLSCSWLNPGMLVFTAACLGYMVFSILSTKIRIL